MSNIKIKKKFFASVINIKFRKPVRNEANVHERSWN